MACILCVLCYCAIRFVGLRSSVVRWLSSMKILPRSLVIAVAIETKIKMKLGD